MTGFRDPPQDTRFKKGQSGNPNGRPKKPKTPPDINDLILSIANQPIMGRKGDQTMQMTALEGALTAQLKSAVGGSPIAQRDFIATATRAAAQKQEEIDDEIAWARNYIHTARAIIDDAKKHGRPEPELLLHPDDVIIDEKRGILLVGTATDEGREAVAYIIKLRDALLLQSVLDDRSAPKAVLADPESRPGTALLYMFLFENFIPKRLRLKESELLMKDWPYRLTSKRELVRVVHRAWRDAGLPLRRGAIFPPFADGVKALEDIFGPLATGHTKDSSAGTL